MRKDDAFGVIIIVAVIVAIISYATTIHSCHSAGYVYINGSCYSGLKKIEDMGR